MQFNKYNTKDIIHSLAVLAGLTTLTLAMKNMITDTDLLLNFGILVRLTSLG